MSRHATAIEILGPWSLATSRGFWADFTPAALAPQADEGRLRTAFLNPADWTRVEASVAQHGAHAQIEVTGDGDLESAVDTVSRFLAIDIDGRAWPDVGRRDPVVGQAQALFPGLRPCGFFSPYEAAAWAVLSQRIRMGQAATLRDVLIDRHGDGGVFPTPVTLRHLELDLPGRKPEYLRAVAEAALEGVLDADVLRALAPAAAIEQVRTVKGLGPFAAELVVLRGANAPDGLATHERRLEDEVRVRYPDGASLATVSQAWRPFRTWASFYLRVRREREGAR